MLVLPTTFQLQRGILLATIFSVACVVAFQYWRVHQDILILWAATMTVGALGITWGALNAAPGALSVTTVYFIWPAVYLVFIGLAHELVVIKKVLSALLLGIALATLMALVVLTAGILGFSDLINPVFFKIVGTVFYLSCVFFHRARFRIQSGWPNGLTVPDRATSPTTWSP